MDSENQKIWLKIQLLKVLCNGRIKPFKLSNQDFQNEDKSVFGGSNNCVNESTVRDSKEFIPIINALCKALEKDLDLYPAARLLND